jgi:hypothetical protein
MCDTGPVGDLGSEHWTGSNAIVQGYIDLTESTER